VRVGLTDLARLADQLHADSDMPLRELAARDRKIGLKLVTGSNQAKLLAWLDALGGEASTDRHLDNVVATLTGWLGVAGLISGISVMSGLLLAGSQQPVNVLLFLTLFIGTQLLFLLLTFITGFSVARGAVLHLPFENLNPARLLLRRVQARLAKHLGEVNLATIARLAVLRWGQLFGVTFNLGAAAAFLLILLVTDRSFGWSSTLDISEHTMLQVTQVLSAPWSGWLPAANISPETVAATRFHALQVVFDVEQSAAMRAWWPFLFLSMVVYGLLPRVLLWSIFQLQYRWRLATAFLHYPGVSLVLERMASPRIDTQAGGDAPPAETGTGSKIGTVSGGQTFAVLIDWAAAETDSSADLRAMGIEADMKKQAGLQLADDRSLIVDLNREKPATLAIAVKSWEPPLADLADFILALNTGGDCFLLLLPLKGSRITTAEKQDWQHFAGQLPHRRVQILAGESAPAAPVQ